MLLTRRPNVGTNLTRQPQAPRRNDIETFLNRPDARKIAEMLVNGGALSAKELVAAQFLLKLANGMNPNHLNAADESSVNALLKRLNLATAISQADVDKILKNPNALLAMDVPADLKDTLAKLTKLAHEYSERGNSPRDKERILLSIRMLISSPNGKDILNRLDAFLKTKPDLREATGAERAKAFEIQQTRTFRVLSERVETLRELLKLAPSADGLTTNERARAKALVELYDKNQAAKGDQAVFAMIEIGKILNNDLTASVLKKADLNIVNKTDKFELYLKYEALLQSIVSGNAGGLGLSQESKELASKLLLLVREAKGKTGVSLDLLEMRFNSLMADNFSAAHRLTDTLGRLDRTEQWSIYKQFNNAADYFHMLNDMWERGLDRNLISAEKRGAIETFQRLRDKLRKSPENRLQTLAEIRAFLLSETAQNVAKTLTVSREDAKFVSKELETLEALLKTGKLSPAEDTLVQKLILAIKGASPDAAPFLIKSILGEAGKHAKNLIKVLRDLKSYTQSSGDLQVDNFKNMYSRYLNSDDKDLKLFGQYIEKMNSATSQTAKNLYKKLASDVVNRSELSQHAKNDLQLMEALQDGVLLQYAKIARNSALQKAIEALSKGTGNIDDLKQFTFESKKGLNAIKAAKQYVFAEMLKDWKNKDFTRFSGLDLLAKLQEKGEFDYWDEVQKKWIRGEKNTLEGVILKQVINRLSASDNVTFSSPDGSEKLSTREYVDLITLRSFAENGWKVGRRNFKEYNPKFSGFIESEFMKNNIIDIKKGNERLKLYENNKEFLEHLSGVQKDIMSQYGEISPDKLDPYIKLFSSIDFAQWLSGKKSDGQTESNDTIKERQEFAGRLLVNIRSLRPDSAQEASAALLNNQVALKVNSAILKEVTEDQLRKAAVDVLEVAERSLAGLANIINSFGGAAAGDWQKFKAILTEMIVKGGVLKGNSNLDVIAEFNAAAARAGIKTTDKMKAKFQELWKTGQYHAITGLATGVAGVLALVHGDNAWERLRAAGHLLDFVSWSHYYAQFFFYKQTRPNSGHWLEKVSGERGEFGNRLLSKIPIIKDFSNFGSKATAFQLSSLINQMSSGATYNLILSVLSSTDYDSLINQFVSDQRNLAAKKRALNAATTPAARQRAQQALDAAKEAAAQSSNRLNEALTANKIDKSAVAGVTTLD